MDKIIENLKAIGLNTYESKVYLALLKKFPATGYEVSKLANIPQARTYDTLKVLEEKKIVVKTNKKPVEYSPIKPKDLTKRFKKRITSTLDYLDSHLPEVKENYNEPILSLSVEESIRDKILEMISNAKSDIYLEIWSSDFKIFEKALLDAYNRNVEIRIVGYNNLVSKFGLVYEHPFPKAIEQSLDGRVIILSVDSMEAALGKIYSDKVDSTNIMWSKNPNMVFLVKELIVHDMFLLDIQQNMTDDLKYTYGKGFKHLHDKILGSNNIYSIHSL